MDRLEHLEGVSIMDQPTRLATQAEILECLKLLHSRGFGEGRGLLAALKNCLKRQDDVLEERKSCAAMLEDLIETEDVMVELMRRENKPEHRAVELYRHAIKRLRDAQELILSRSHR